MWKELNIILSWNAMDRITDLVEAMEQDETFVEKLRIMDA